MKGKMIKLGIIFVLALTAGFFVHKYHAIIASYIIPNTSYVKLTRAKGLLSTGEEQKYIVISKDELKMLEETDKKYMPIHYGDSEYMSDYGVIHYYTEDELKAVSMEEVKADYEEIKAILGIGGTYESTGGGWDSDYTTNIKTFISAKEEQ